MRSFGMHRFCFLALRLALVGLALAWLAPSAQVRDGIPPEPTSLSIAVETTISLWAPGRLAEVAQLLVSAPCDDTDDPPASGALAASLPQATGHIPGIRECASAPKWAERRVPRAHQATGPPLLTHS
jgi:hypothetical protein